jgi:glycosyltransferase involved in cell wall biosynthesis
MHTIDRAITSAINQEWSNKEIIVVDDYSSDGSIQYLKDTWESNKGITLIFHESNLGVGATRNTLLEKASGDFIAFFDDDDESMPSRVSQQYQRILEVEKLCGHSLVASFTARKQVFSNGKTRIEKTLGTTTNMNAAGDNLVALILYGRPIKDNNGSCATCSMMARKSVLTQLKGFDPNLRRGEDTDFNMRLGAAGGVIAGESQALVTQYLISADYKRAKEEKRNKLNLFKKYKDIYFNQSNYLFTIGWIELTFSIQEKGLFALSEIMSLFIRYPLKSLRRLYWAWLHRRN